MRKKIRCRFELYSGDVCGLPADLDAVKLLVEHHKVAKRYAATDALPASQGSTLQLEGAQTTPLLAFTCHVYPSKVVNLRLMGRSSSTLGKPSLLSHNNTWTQLATATLHLDQLARQLLLPGIAAAPATPRASAELAARPHMPAATVPARPGDVTTAQVVPAPTSRFATGDLHHLPAEEQLSGVLDDLGRGNCMQHPAAEAEAAVSAGPAAVAEKVADVNSHHLGRLSDLKDFEGIENTDDVWQAVQDAVDVPLAAAVRGGPSAEAVYGAELQSSTLTVAWTPAQQGLLLQQQLVVQAHLLPSRGPGWAQGIFRAANNRSSSVASSSRRTSTSATTASGSVLTRRKHRSLQPSSGAFNTGAAVNRPGPSLNPHDAHTLTTAPPTAAAGGATSAPASPAHAKTNTGTQAAGRPPSFERWVDTLSADPTSDTSHLPAGHPLKFLASRVPAATPGGRPLADHPASAAGCSDVRQQQAEAAGEGADDEQTAKHEFLQLILATLSSAHSVESEAALPPPSAAQLAAAASLPRAPSAADLAAFAAAAGLPIEKVAEAAATKLGPGSAPTSAAAACGGGSSAGPRAPWTTPRTNTTETVQDDPAEPVDRATAAARTAPAPVVLSVAAPEQIDAIALQSNRTSPAAEVQPPDSSAVNAIDSAAATLDPEAATAAAIQGEIESVAVDTHSDMEAVGPAAKESAVAVRAVTEAVPGHSRGDVDVAQGAAERELDGTATTSAAAADDEDADDDDVASAVAEGSSGDGVGDPPAVVTATAMALLDDSSSASAACQQSAAQGWQPQQLSVATTTFAATPVCSDPEGEDGVMAATADTHLSSADVVVSSSTNVVVTHVSDAEVADFAAPVPGAPAVPAAAAAASYFDSDGPGGLPGPAAAAPPHPPVYRGGSLCLGGRGEVGAMQLHTTSKAAATAVQDFSEAAAAADASTASAASWAAEHGAAEPVIAGAGAATGPSAAGGPALPAAARGLLTTVQEAADQTETTPPESSTGNPALASTGRATEGASGLLPGQPPPDEALQYVTFPAAGSNRLAAMGSVGRLEPTPSAAKTSAGCGRAVVGGVPDTPVLPHGRTAGMGASSVSRHLAAAEQVSPAGPAVDVDQTEQEQQISKQQLQQPAEVISEESLELQVVDPNGAEATEATEAETVHLPAYGGSDGTAAAAADTPPAVDQVTTLHPAAPAELLLHGAAAGPQGSYWSPEQHSAQQQQQQQPSGMSLSAHYRLHQHAGVQLQPASSVTSRLAEVLERINSQPQLARAAPASSPDAWPVALTAAPQRYNSQEVDTYRGLGGSGLSSSSTLITTAGSVVLAVPQLLLSTALTAAQLAGSRARTRATTRRGTGAAQSGTKTGAASAAYLGIKRAAAVTVDLVLFIPRSIALGLLSVWLLLVTQLILRPWLAMLSRGVPAIHRWSGTPMTEQAAAAADDHRGSDHLLATGANSTEPGAVDCITSSSVAEQEGVDAAAVRVLSGDGASADNDWAQYAPGCFGRAPSLVHVPPTPAPSLEVGQSPCTPPERSWSRMIGLLGPALSRSLSVSSGPATPPPTPAHSAAAAALPQLDLSPAPISDAVHTSVRGSSSSSRPRHSRLGTSCTGGLSTICSVTDLVTAAEAAEAAADSEAVAADDVRRRNTWWWGTGRRVTPTDAQSNHSGGDSNSRTWWKTWRSSSASWPLLRGTNSSAGPELAAVEANNNGNPALVGSLLSVPVSTDAQSSSSSSSSNVQPAAFQAFTARPSWLESTTHDIGNTFQQLLQILLTPVVWYFDAVTSVLRSGVHTAAWLVELAVWWALLPGRAAWCGIMLPFRACAAVWGLIMFTYSSSSSSSSSRGGMDNQEGPGAS